jgi:hypothetical protein
MDPELQKRIDAARAQGFTDEEIQQTLGTDAGQSTQPEASMPGGYNVPILSAEEKARFQQSQQQVEQANNTENYETLAVGAGIGLAAAGVPLLIYKGAKAVLNPAAQSTAEYAQRGVASMEQANEIARQTEARVAANQAAKAAAAQTQTLRPVAPSPILDQYGRAIPTAAQPVAPTGTAPMAQAPAQPAPRGPSMIDKTTGMIRQLAANKVVQGLARGANVLGGAQMAAYSPELGPKTPQVGRMRGMEINPMTSRPWTPEQIKQYESNPMVFDQQMAPPQMRR